MQKDSIKSPYFLSINNLFHNRLNFNGTLVIFGKGYDGLGDCHYNQGLWCLKGCSVFSIQFFSR